MVRQLGNTAKKDANSDLFPQHSLTKPTLRVGFVKSLHPIIKEWESV